MAGDNPHVLELRRRVQEDPASTVFAQLAEECRCNGDTEEAVGVALAGLAHHPGLLSARVTLGRALLELGRLDEAHRELLLVLDHAPDNLLANRAIAELYHSRGQLPSALIHYRRALELTANDTRLEHQVEGTESAVSPPPSPTVAAADAFFDFDTLIQQLSGHARTAEVTSTTPQTSPTPALKTPGEIDAVRLRDDDGDPFSVLERQLRETDDQRMPSNEARSDDESEQRMKAELEGWLAAILRDRDSRSSA